MICNSTLARCTSLSFFWGRMFQVQGQIEWAYRIPQFCVWCSGGLEEIRQAIFAILYFIQHIRSSPYFLPVRISLSVQINIGILISRKSLDVGESSWPFWWGLSSMMTCRYWFRSWRFNSSETASVDWDTILFVFLLDYGNPCWWRGSTQYHLVYNPGLKVMVIFWRQVMAFDLDMISIGCVAPMDPVMKFSTRVSFHLVGMQRGTHRELMLVTSNQFGSDGEK